MNPVINALREHIANQNVRFVFPSQTAADMWAQKTCTLGIARSVAKNRFLAWDRFKEEIVRKEERAPSSMVIRKLFAEALLGRNAEGSFLKSVVPPEYAKGGKVFALFVARLLPSLARWEKLVDSVRGVSHDEEDGDFFLLKREYAAFLERHKIFEPSWEEIKISEGGGLYLIFFPELVEDFSEYDALLTAPRFIRVGAATLPAARELVSFRSAREEIRNVAAEIQTLREEGVPYEDMAVSVPGLEEMEPVLLKEFSLRHIPFTRRAGKKLGETGAGRLFSLANDCVSSEFSFNSLKALLLNDHVPWREREKNSALIRYGIRYNCVSSYTENGAIKDIWEESFKEAPAGDLRYYYGKIKELLLALARAKSFREIRKWYFALRGYSGSGFLDMDKISADDDAVLSRCIEELSGLIELEEQLGDPSLVPSSPYAFFISCLGEKEYVRANQKSGVNVFKWRVAAASPFACHFVLNASQSAASVLYRPMGFLRQDKRKALGLEDTDASGAFFTLCNTGEEGAFKSRVRISASAQTFSGWAIPHCFFAGREVPADAGDSRPRADPYGEERRFWKTFARAESAPPQRIYPLQKKAFERWKTVLALKENYFDFFGTPVPEGSGADAVRELLRDAFPGKDGCLVVTPTNDLNVYYGCAMKWLYARIFGAEEFSLEAALLDDTSLGLLYHRILQNLFEKIKAEDRIFDAGRLDAYKHWTLEITEAAIREHPAFSGPLAVPLVSPQAAGMAKKIAGLLELEAKHFANYEVAALEFPVGVKTGSLLVKGIIDRVSLSPEGEPVIIDYKTSYLPEQTAPGQLEEVRLAEFQMPLYIRLYEESAVEKGNFTQVKGAFFYSINGRKIKTAMGEDSGRSKAPDRKEYEPFLEAAEKQIGEFGGNVMAFDFVPRDIKIGDCLKCVYKTVCRAAYFLNLR